MVIGRPYLRRKGRKGSQKTIRWRWRCGNEEEKNKYWKKEENKRCRICKREEGSITHI